jgi:hypothetical protein
MKKLIAIVLFAIIGCSTIHPAPLPASAIACGSDWACPQDMHCGFPGVDTYAQCMPGDRGERADRWHP